MAARLKLARSGGTGQRIAPETPSGEARTLLGRTWNTDDWGLLWECEWYRKDGRYFSTGTYSGTEKWDSEEAFWAAFEEGCFLYAGERETSASYEGC